MFRMLHLLTRSALALAAVTVLSGCVAYPAGYYGGYGGGYYAAPAPAVVVPVYPSYGYGGRWGHWGRWR